MLPDTTLTEQCKPWCFEHEDGALRRDLHNKKTPEQTGVFYERI